MRTLFAAALLLVSVIAAAEDAPTPLSIAVEPLGDHERGVVARVFFRFANPHAVTEAGLFVEGSFAQRGEVPRNFRYAVPRKNDRWIWDIMVVNNGKLVRDTRWSVLPDKRNEMSANHIFAEGEAEIVVWLILEKDDGRSPTVVAKAEETFTLAKTGRPYVPAEVETAAEATAETAVDDEPVAEPEATVPEVAPEERSAVLLGASPREIGSPFYVVAADVLPPVKRVEFWLAGKKVLARNAAPYLTELDLGETPKGVTLRAIGFDAAGRYVDADAFIVNDEETPLRVTLTRTDTSDGFSHFKINIRNRKGAPLKSVILYAGEQRLHAFDGPPYALSVSTASLADADSVRVVVVDETGTEASDRHVVRARR